jgi:nitronate monooxygenase
MLVQVRGMKKLEAAVKPGNYNNLWSAGQSSQLVNDIISCENITDRLESELINAFNDLSTKIK